MKKIFSLPLLILLLTANNVAAQQHAPAKPGAFKLFFEKVYLHMDRGYYAAGDNIWFKAYLVNAQSNYPSNTSDNLYVELIGPDKNIVSREVIRLDHGMGAGDFKLDDSIPGGNYRIRAYTNWMRNFGNHFIFERPLTIQTVIHLSVLPAEPARQTEPAGRTTVLYNIQFLPEGGSLVEGLSSVVAFKATDSKDRAVAVTGILLSSKGDTVLRFQSTYLGMGSFVFTPQSHLSYTALLHYPTGSPITRNLPDVVSNGYAMSIQPKDTAFAVHIQAAPVMLSGHPDPEVTLTGRHGGKLYYGEKFTLVDGQALVIMPKKDFPEGIASLTLYDEALHPQCERLVYVEKNDPVTITMSTDEKTYQPGEKVTIHIQATDAQNQPVRTALSLSAVDRGIINPDPGNILSYLDLESELKGWVENAAAYFDPANSRRFEQLDLLLLTQGWRSFLWRSLADTSIRISYLPEPGITISGRVRETIFSKPLSNMNITLYAVGAKGNKFYSTHTDSAGRYFIDGLELYGVQTIKINSKNTKGDKGGWLFMDTLFNNPVPTDQPSFSITDAPVIISRYAKEATQRWIAAQKEPFHSVLPGVTVTNRTKPVRLRDGSIYTSFGYPEYDFTIGSKDLAYETLANFLVHNVPGAVEDVEHEGVNFIVEGRPVRPKFMVDNREDVFERIDYYAVHMDQVNSVSVRHLVGPPSFSRGGTSAAGRVDRGANIRDLFVIYLSLKPDAFNDDLALINAEVRGYYEARSFYAPSPDARNEHTLPDVRTTLFWEPYITTDADGKAAVTFYNADPATTIGIDVEGITEKGQPVTGSGKYTVSVKK